MKIKAWQMIAGSSRLSLVEWPVPTLRDDEVLVRVCGCGVCHTDLGFFYEGVKTVKAPPLTLGHEISGFVDDAGSNARSWMGKAVIVPAVLPCGSCDLCLKGEGRICRSQQMPGNHMDGGFASHVVVPSRYLCAVKVKSESESFGESGVTLRELSVVADAVTTPYQAIKSAGLASGDLAVFVGVGGIGGFGVQIAAAIGARVVAIDVDDGRLTFLRDYGAALTLNPRDLDAKMIRRAVQDFAKSNGLSPYQWKIFETSGTTRGQELAFALLTFGSTLSVVGFTMDQPQIRLSNLMAFDARAIGNWGCHPDYYPEVLERVQKGQIRIGPFVEIHALDMINDVFERSHRRELKKRPVLVPAV